MSPFPASLFLILLSLTSRIHGQVDWTTIDATITSYMSRNQFPGLALSIVNASAVDNVQVFGKGYGVMDRETNTSTTNTTLFFIASVSKSFTAVVISRFLSKRYPNLGKTALDTPVSILSPTYNLTLIDRFRSEHVTLRDLLSHKVCINSRGLGGPAMAYKTRSEVIYRSRYMPELCGFRSGFQYNNNMFVLAGEIVSHIAGVPFETLVEEFLDELNMTDTRIVTDTDDYEVLPNLSKGYYLGQDGTLQKTPASVYNTPFGPAAGGIISNAADMGKYLAFHLTKGKNLNGEQVVSEDVMSWLYETSNYQEIFMGRNPEDPNEPILYRNYGYGLGLNLGVTRDGYREIGHGGDLSPFTGQLTYLPMQGYGLYIVTNGPGNPPITDGYLQLQDKLFDILRGTNTADSSATARPALDMKLKPNLTTGMKKPATNIGKRIDPENLVGTFGHPVEGDIIISWNGTALLTEYGRFGGGYLVEQEPNSNIYVWKITGELSQILLAAAGGYPLPDIILSFDGPDILEYQLLTTTIRYTRDATIGTYPDIPWDQGSC